MNKNKILCPCNKVTKGDVLRAMDKGASNFKAVQKKTDAGAKCGKCEKRVKQFIKKQKEKE